MYNPSNWIIGFEHAIFLHCVMKRKTDNVPFLKKKEKDIMVVQECKFLL